MLVLLNNEINVNVNISVKTGNAPHLVFSPKYRGKVLEGEVAEAAEENRSLEKKALPKKHVSRA